VKIPVLKHLGDQIINQVADRYGACSAEHITAKEAWRVYLLWMEAPEITPQWLNDDEGGMFFDLGLDYKTQDLLDGKRVRLVEVKE